MITITSSFELKGSDPITLDHNNLNRPILVHRPKDGNYTSSSYKLSKNKDGKVIAYSTKLPILDGQCDFIHAHAVGFVYPIEQDVNQTGGTYYKTSMSFFNKFYVKLLFFGNAANLLGKLIKDDPAKISSMEVIGRLQSKEFNDNVFYSILVSEFNVVGWKEQKEEKKEEEIPF